jgi:hypothetical protein
MNIFQFEFLIVIYEDDFQIMTSILKNQPSTIKNRNDCFVKYNFLNVQIAILLT